MANSAEFRIAHGYYRQARLLFQEGRCDAATDLLDASLEFFPEYSESDFLYAKIHMRQQETIWKAIGYLESALHSGFWTETQPPVAAAELARLYVLTSRFREARRTILELGETGLGGWGNPELSALWAQALVGLGLLADAQDYLDLAVRRYPRSPVLYKLYARVMLDRGSRQAAREVLRRGIRELPGQTELIYQLASAETDKQFRLDLVEQYLRSGGSDPGAALLALSALQAGSSDQERFLDLFFRMQGNSRVDYLDGLTELLDGQRIPGLPQSFTGVRIRDGNRDGFYEQRYRYQEGVLKQFISDQNQDGIAEASILFAENKPDTVSLSRDEGAADLEYRYSDYPFLDTAVVFSGGWRREYRMVPYTVRRPAFVTLSSKQFGLDLRSDLRAEEDQLRASAYLMEEHGPNAPYAQRRTHLLADRITRIEDLPDGRGNFTRSVYYSDSLPAEGLRDLDGDGIPEIRELYRGGRLWKITLDQDGDGKPEFAQVLEDDEMLTFWDYNDDGVYDSREVAASDGLSSRDFSSTLDGSFDLTSSGGSR